MEPNLETGQASGRGRQFSAAELSALLSGAPFLAGLGPEVVAEVAAACELLQVPGDQRVIRREVPNDSLYVVVHGGLRTVAPDARGQDRIVAESYRGESVGLLGLVPGLSAPVDVLAIRDSVLLRLTRARFTELGAHHPELVLRLAEGIARRGAALLAEQPRLTPLMRPGAAAQNLALVVPTRDRYFAPAAADLARAALEQYCGVAHVTRASLEAALGEGAASTPPRGAENERVVAWLQNLESDRDLVLYECDSTLLPWSERCLRQADRVLIIVRADQPEHLAEVRALLALTLRREQAPRLEVALVHAEQVKVPARVPAFGDWAKNARIHHIRMGRRDDYQRLARTLVRTGVGLVLSGGAARGIAHLGVLKAFEDAHVPIDAIAGTSMGSIFAAGYARGWDADALLARVRELFQSRMALYDPTLPSHALLAGRKLEKVMRLYFEDLDIENLWLPFFCVSTNLSRAEARIHDRGKLWEAVAASCSIPGVFPPRLEGADRLVDGGVMNNLPIDLMAQRFEGAVIGSDVSPHGETAPEQRRERGGLRRWLGREREGAAPADGGPGIFEVLVRSTMVGSAHTTQAALARGDASLVLSLPVTQFRMLDWRAHDELFEAGYRYARQQLASWQPPWRARVPVPAR